MLLRHFSGASPPSMPLTRSPNSPVIFAALLSSVAVGLLGIVCGVTIMRQRKDRTRPLHVSAQLSSSISGLLAGLSLLVLLPSAVDGLETPNHSNRVMFCFALGPLSMYFFHHVLLGHNCSVNEVEAPRNDLPPSKHTWWKPSEMGCDMTNCGECVPESGLAANAPPSFPGKGASSFTPLTSVCTILLRVSAWAAHAILDGFMLGSAQSIAMVGATTIPVALCAMQDASTLVLGHLGRGDSQREALISVVLLAVCFPLGAACALCLASWPFAFAPPSGDVLLYLRAFTAGIFLYMAVFEFAPPHAHGRFESLRRLLAFALGLAVAWLAEALEDAVVSGASPASAAALGPAPHLDTEGHWARAVPAMGPAVATLMQTGGEALLPTRAT